MNHLLLTKPDTANALATDKSFRDFREMFRDCAFIGEFAKKKKSGEGFLIGKADMHQPFCHSVISNLPDLSGLNICILFNPEFFLETLRVTRHCKIAPNITFYTGSINGNSTKWPSNVNVVHCNPFCANIGHLMNQAIKFDYTIGNVPFKNGLHTKIINNVIKVSKKLLIIQPATLLYNNRVTTKGLNSQDQLYVDNYKKYQSHAIFFNGNTCFENASIRRITSITYINTEQLHDSVFKIYDSTSGVDHSYNYNSFEDINIYGDYPEVYALQKILTKDLNMGNSPHRANIQRNWHVNLKVQRGNTLSKGKKLFADDFFTICNNYDTVSQTMVVEKSGDPTTYGFDTKQEAESFLSFIKTKVARYAIGNYKVSEHARRAYSAVPWIDTSTGKIWDNASVCKELGIDAKLWNFIDKTIP